MQRATGVLILIFFWAASRLGARQHGAKRDEFTFPY
jgi:hypothetical protein